MITRDVYDYIEANGPSTVSKALNTGYTLDQVQTATEQLFSRGFLHKTKQRRRGGPPINVYSIKNEYNPQQPAFRDNTRKCSNCHKWKPFSEFHKASNGGQGIQNTCKDCNGITYGERALTVYDILMYWDSDRRIAATHYEDGPLDTPCLIWDRSTSSKYGQVVIKKRLCRTHRLALITRLKRQIGEGLTASHLCHNQLCCNPSHVIEETYSNNSRRSYADGRDFGRVKVDKLMI